MRRSFLVAVGLSFVASVLPLAADAGGNVISPQFSPNLGVAPAAPPSSTTAGSLYVRRPGDPVSSNTTTPPLGAPGGGAPNIIKQTKRSALDPSTLHSLAISFSDKSSFTDMDAAIINEALGLKRNQVSSDCELSVRGHLTTDKGVYMVGTGMEPRELSEYEGTIQSFSMQANALCLSNGTAPKTAQELVQVGDRYAIPLQQIDCPAPDHSVSGLVITYNGEHPARCAYQY